MIIVADSGSTKTTWCLQRTERDIVSFSTEGYNPYYVDSNYILKSVTSGLPNEVIVEKISEVNFYGAGCSPDKAWIMEKALKGVFFNAVITVELDLLASARAVLGKDEGFAAILGTGTNSCIYNGKFITHIVDSLGFMIGDEGSGAYLGKKLLVAYCRGLLPSQLAERFYEDYKLSGDEIISKLYSSELPNRFCAGFCRFVKSHEEHPFIKNLIYSSFRDFFRNIVCHYPNYSKYSLNCIGSVAFSFLPFLTEVAKEFDMTIGNVIKSPMDGLMKFHKLEAKAESPL